jgi:hypothetical protein
MAREREREEKKEEKSIANFIYLFSFFGFFFQMCERDDLAIIHRLVDDSHIWATDHTAN